MFSLYSGMVKLSPLLIGTGCCQNISSNYNVN